MEIENTNENVNQNKGVSNLVKKEIVEALMVKN